MRKQYRCIEGVWPAYRFNIYHNGVLSDSYTKLETEINDEKQHLESLGYTYGYTENEVKIAYSMFEHRAKNLIQSPDV